MKYNLVIRPEAEADIQDAYNWYEDRAEGLGAGFLISIDASFHSMLRNPLKHPVIYNTIRRALTRRFPYQILFLVKERQIIILSVFHVRRDPVRWKIRS